MQDRTQALEAIDRRTFVRRTGAVTGTLALAGCTSTDDESDENESDPADDDAGNGSENETGDGGDATLPRQITVEDPPEAVYLPTHRESMQMLEPVEAGDYALAPMLSYPHQFWVIAGDADDAVERTTPDDPDGVHMMFVAWDTETGTVLPVDEGVQIRIRRDGEQVGAPRQPWAMLSQEMGFHFGDNVGLPGDGTYTVEVTLPPISTRKTGDLAGRLDERATATFEFEYDDEFRESVVGGVEYLDEERWGERGALEPMGMMATDENDSDSGIPYSMLPPVDAYPGTLLLESDSDNENGGPDHENPETSDLPRSGDAGVLATLLESEHRLAGDGQYLLVSPRTPYNRVPLADMSLRATIERDGTELGDAPLEQTLDGEYGLHYGVSLSEIGDVSGVEAGDSVAIEIESPPQIARHQGYETAFLEMPPVELVVPKT
ncbi:DUF7350 domain-containing protein [Halopiger xanaduensis]|uniref:DUF7350 domain-containing protein n=1 Tax=Halopiger xanaduensis (strain DSM 18323 / JCM 14033 / SH-6) TaxID=797210 RepID=F8D813_HALXS|nr:hypothetical protein [Halopiger xanaduensis]AEH37905.1 hypothetical protein Halxa_3293 [Halopiger xanaduensis SH-6]